MGRLNQWFIFVFLSVYAGTVAWGQLDPEKRRLVQFGYNQPLEGRGPIAGYTYYYLNDPNFLSTNTVLRLALAPVYLDAELGLREVLPRTDVGVGVAGGGFADSYSELRQGKFWREESFTGHGAELNTSLYHLFNPQDKIPLHAILRVGAHQYFFQRDNATAPNFVIPENQPMLFWRSGVRWGGSEPLILPALAMELSAWYEGQYRADHGLYGYAQDRVLKPSAHLFWSRALLAYTLPQWQHNLNLSLTAGTSMSVDRFSAYRLGAVLPLGAEFPLTLPGYYFEELSARRFALLSGQYAIPLGRAKSWSVIGYGGTALVDYLSGLEQPGHWHSGVGGGISWQSRSRAWWVMLGYGYGIDAIRSDGRGANVVGLFCQFDLEARHRKDISPEQPQISPNKFRGFDWMLGR